MQPAATPSAPDIAPPKTKKAGVEAKPTLLPYVRRLAATKKSLAIAGAVAVVVIGLITWLLINAGSNPNSAVTAPHYQTVLPAGKTIRALGGWKRVSPPEKEPVFAYTDAIAGVAVSVSQQPLPKSFKDATDSQVAELAAKFNATDKIDAGDTKAYIGTSAKGPQSVIFAKKRVLVLIKSAKKISDTAWAQYIASLD